MGYDCVFILRGSVARVFVCRHADMGYDCAFALRGSGARVCVRIRRYGQGLRSRSPWLVVGVIAVFGYGDVGKDCALALLGLVLVFIPVVAERQLPWSAYSADHRDCPVADHRQSVRRLGCARSAGSSGADVEKTVESPQLQLVEAPGAIPPVLGRGFRARCVQ